MRATVWLLACAALAVVGCSQSGIVKVTGTVTLNGQPTDQAEVMFNPKKGGRIATGVTDSSGHFSLSTTKPGDGADPGEYTVTLNEYYPPGKAPALPRGGGPLPSRFAPKYGDPTQTPLTATVERGKTNDFKFDATK
jgi:hypothetical protein